MQDEIKLITLRTFGNSINAHIAKTRLESEGIECYLFDENITTLNPLYNVTVGGIKLTIKDSDYERAEEILSEIDNSELTDENNEVITCPKCGSKELYSGFKSMKGVKGIFSAIVSFLFMVFPIYYKTVYRCKKCGFEFQIKDKISGKQ